MLGPLWGPVADLKKHFNKMDVSEGQFRDFLLDHVDKEHVQIKNKCRKKFKEHIYQFYLNEATRSARMSLVAKKLYNAEKFNPKIEVRKYLKQDHLSDEDFKDYVFNWIEKERPKVVNRYIQKYKDKITNFYAEELKNILE